MADMPTITRNANGTVFMTLPENPASEYPVTVELLREWVNVINENVALRYRIQHLEELLRIDREQRATMDGPI